MLTLPNLIGIIEKGLNIPFKWYQDHLYVSSIKQGMVFYISKIRLVFGLCLNGLDLM